MLVSINCVTFNHEDTIGQSIEGFLSQKTDFDYEIIIGEDCSSDMTLAIIQDYMKKFPNRIKLITSTGNVGPGQNSMRVFHASSGEYIALCEGDDYWIDEYKLQKQVNYMKKHMECMMCFHAAKIWDVRNSTYRDVIRPYHESKKIPIEDVFTGGGLCHTGSILFRKSLLDEIPAFFASAHVGDYALQMWCGLQGEIYYIDEPMSVYRTNQSGSWSNDMFIKSENTISLVKKDIELLKAVMRESKECYYADITKNIRKKEFELLILEKRILSLWKHHYREFITNMSTLQKTKLILRCVFPRLYLFIGRHFRHSMKLGM